MIAELDVQSAGITSVILATGYKFDFRLAQLPILDPDGYPVQKRGITDYPGLCHMGLPWLHQGKSSLLDSVGDDVAFIASDLATRTLA